ncbi:LAQU0S27e00760g1_1 [Lachancea quebecensis]|uniref:LAQU0S27e00760g1_1 n=1 Tax=Lachancea quebecensis TaxID=1654605 RepID=A0A0P1KY43_9SACH|nr:LAQU0S27e00760g1_1 [Lachancea quebecensis]
MEGGGVGDYLLSTVEKGDQSLELPRDLFPSKLLYYVIRNRSALIGLGLVLALFAFAFIGSRKIIDRGDRVMARLVIIVVGFFSVLLTFLSIQVGVASVIREPENQFRFMEEIATIKPGLEMGKWDVVAARMNPFLHRSSSLATPYYFYDGESCHSCFRKDFLYPYLRRNNTNSTYAASLDEFSTFIGHVLESYQERLNEGLLRILDSELSADGQNINL